MPKASVSDIVLSVDRLQPTPGFVLVEPARAQKQTAAGIYLPDSHEEQLQHGVVLAVGADVVTESGKQTSPAKKGDTVIFKKWGGNEVKIGDVEYQFLKFEDILAIVK